MVELLDTVELILEPHLGPVAATADNRHFIEACLEEFCYGIALPEGGDIGYFLPSDVTKKIREAVKQAIFTCVQAGFGMIYPTRMYSFAIAGDDVYMEEHDIAKVPQFAVEPPETMCDDNEHGDFIPERLRRKGR